MKVAMSLFCAWNIILMEGTNSRFPFSLLPSTLVLTGKAYSLNTKKVLRNGLFTLMLCREVPSLNNLDKKERKKN